MAPGIRGGHAHAMRTISILVLLGLLAGACGKHAAHIPTQPAVTTARYSWLGSYVGASDQGTVAIDLTRRGSALAGEIVFSSSTSHFFHLVGAMVSDSMDLSLDPAVFPDPTDFTLHARVQADGGMAGNLKLVSSGIDAGVTCRALPRRGVGTHTAQTYPIPVIAIAYDGARLWLSTSGTNYVLMTVDGTPAGTVTIAHSPNASWTSSVLGFDGVRMWGVYPISISGPGGTVNVADLLGFTSAGRTLDSLRLGHRPGGLAFDGASLWSLRGDPIALIRFDSTGRVTDSLRVEIPDANQLAFDGTSFWTVGWYLRRLYEVDAGGHVVAFCDIPGTDPGNLTVGLTVEGSHLWYAEGWLGSTTLHRLSVQ